MNGYVLVSDVQCCMWRGKSWFTNSFAQNCRHCVYSSLSHLSTIAISCWLIKTLSLFITTWCVKSLSGNQNTIQIEVSHMSFEHRYHSFTSLYWLESMLLKQSTERKHIQKHTRWSCFESFKGNQINDKLKTYTFISNHMKGKKFIRLRPSIESEIYSCKTLAFILHRMYFDLGFQKQLKKFTFLQTPFRLDISCHCENYWHITVLDGRRSIYLMQKRYKWIYYANSRSLTIYRNRSYLLIFLLKRRNLLSLSWLLRLTWCKHIYADRTPSTILML